MREKINLLHVVLELHSGGLQRLITDLSLAMDRTTFNVEVCCLNELGLFAEKLQSNGIKVTLLSKGEGRLIFFPLKLARFMKQRNVHIAHMHPGAYIFGALAGWLARIPAIVYTEHGRAAIEARQRVYEDRISAALSDRVIAVSEELETYLVKSIHMSARKVCTVINGIRTDIFAPRGKSEKILQELGIAPSTQVVGTVARLSPIKDQLTMLSAFKKVQERLPDIHLVLLGDGPERSNLERFVSESNLSEHVTITGERDDVPEVLSIFDIFILSSIREGTSVSLLEAMSSGVAPIVTNVGGNPAVVSDQRDGLVVKAKDPDVLANAIVELLSNDAKRKLFAERASKKVQEHYSISKMLESYVEIYFDILRRKRRTRHLSPQLETSPAAR